MKMSIKKTLIVTASVIPLLVILSFIVRFYLVNDWNEVETESINCPTINLTKVKDVEGNIFVFTDTADNSNFKTNSITFNEKKLGVKSLAKISNSSTSLNYLSKNVKISYDELSDLQECYKEYNITISNNYDFDKGPENRFCNFESKNNRTYEILSCR